MDRKRVEIHARFNINTQTWDKTTTHQLRMYNHNNASGTLGQWIEKEKKYMHFSIQTCMHILKNMHGTRQQLTP